MDDRIERLIAEAVRELQYHARMHENFRIRLRALRLLQDQEENEVLDPPSKEDMLDKQAIERKQEEGITYES